MRVRKLSELTPEQIEELRCPMPSMKLLEKTVDIGVGDVVFEGIEEANIPLRAAQEFRQGLNLTTIGQINNIQAADFPEATARFVHRIIASKGFFKDAAEVADKMTAAQGMHAFAIAYRICFLPAPGMSKESTDFFSKTTLIQELATSDQVMSFLDKTYETTAINSVVIRVMFEQMNKMAEQLKMQKLDLAEAIQSGAISDEKGRLSSSSTDSVEAASPAKPSSESTGSTSV